MGPNLQNILCKNKHKLIPNSHTGGYKFKYLFRSVYDGKQRKKSLPGQQSTNKKV